MKRVILDTNIYGKLVERQEHMLALANRGKVKVYGSVIIRRELRDVPKGIRVAHEGTQRKVRLVVLEIYDSLVGERTLPITLQIEELSQQYFVAYKKFAGTKPSDVIAEDFMIVATATLHGLEVVYSDDKATMLSESSLRAYDMVNTIHNLETPKFESYENFIRELGLKTW